MDKAFKALTPRARPASYATPTKRGARRNAVKEREAVRERAPRDENAPGDFFVDHTCIDCDTCRWMQPAVFNRVNGQTAVTEQPSTEEDRFRATQALLACPTHSIHLQPSKNGEIRAAAASFPHPVSGTKGLYHCGYHSESSYGAASYLIQRVGGNVMVDSPRFDRSLLKNIKELGGAKYMFLTHKDDVADHARWAEELGLQRIIHKTEATSRQGTTECEEQLEGEGPWQLPGGSADIEMILTPGHTKGHTVLLYNGGGERSGTCFTGDHLAWSRAGPLTVFKRVNWYSVDKQLESTAKLRDLPFLNILPGHGRPGVFKDHADRRSQIDMLLESEGYSG